MDPSESSAGIRPKNARSRISRTVRTGCTTRPTEKAISAVSMASISSPIVSTARTSDSDSQRGIVRHFSAPLGKEYYRNGGAQPFGALALSEDPSDSQVQARQAIILREFPAHRFR